MKRFSGLALVFLALSTTACMTHKERRHDEVVVSETYTHRYGVEVSPDDWSSRGQSGKVSSTLANGVVVTKNYDNGILEGECTYTFPHQSAIEKVEIYKQNELTTETYNYSSGTPRKQIQHVSPTKLFVYQWYDNGTPLCSEEYDNNNLVSAQYFNPDHQVEASVVNQQGTRINRDNYGMVQSNDTIENGQVVLQTLYHPNNAPKSVTPYVNGRVDGTQRTYLPGGEPESISTWSDGVRHGDTTHFVNGERQAVVPYESGQKHGVEQRYRDGTEVVKEVNWVNDKQHGPSQTYSDDNVSTDWYYDGQPVSKVKYDALMSHQRG